MLSKTSCSPQNAPSWGQPIITILLGLTGEDSKKRRSENNWIRFAWSMLMTALTRLSHPKLLTMKENMIF